MIARIKALLFKNSTPGQTVAKNVFWLSISNFGGRFIKAIIIIYGARVLGTVEWGVLSYALTLAGFLTLFIDPGINGIVIREVPKSAGDRHLAILSTAFVIKLVLIVIAVLFVLFVAPFFSTLPGASMLLPIVALIIVFDTLREFFSSFMRAKEKMEWEASVFLLTNIGIVVFGFLFLALFPRTALTFGWAYAAGTVIGAIAAAIVIGSYLKHALDYFSLRLIKPIMTSAWPFAVTGALGALLTNADILIISWMRSASEVGIYAAAIRIVQLLYLVPMIFQFSTLPLLSRLANKDDDAFRAVLERTVSIVFLTSIPIAILGAVLGTQIMGLIFSAAYVPGSLAFKILMATLIFDFPAAIIATAIFAYNRQKNLIVTSAIAGVSNVLFDLALIPFFGIAGSAVATLLANILSNWYLWRMMRKINDFHVLPRLKKPIVAGILMGAIAILFLLLGVNVVLNALACGIIYLLMLYFLQEPLLLEMKRMVFVPLGYDPL